MRSKKSKGRPRATGRFKTRKELEDFVKDRYFDMVRMSVLAG